MNQDILQIPIDKSTKYFGPFHTEFIAGNKLTPDWEVITTSLIDGLKLAVYNRDIVSILFNEVDIEFLWNYETRNLLANYENISFVEFFSTVIRNKWNLKDLESIENGNP